MGSNPTPATFKNKDAPTLGVFFVFDHACEGESQLLDSRVGFERNFDILPVDKIKIPGSRINFAAAKFRGDRIPPPQQIEGISITMS